MDKKQKLNLVVIGHVDSGKSTTTGHLIYKCGGIDKRTMEKYEKESSEIGKSSFKYAWVLDKMKEERERGITIDIQLWKFETKDTIFTIIDAPGHRDFIKNMITGASHADAAMLVVDSSKGSFESGISQDGQTREHSMLISMLGIKQIVVVINKMDTVDYSKDRYNEIKDYVDNFLKGLGYKNNIPYVPVSGFIGENLTEKSKLIPWYEGKCLVDTLNDLKEPERPINKPLRIPVHDVYKIGGIGTVPIGRVESGVARIGMPITISPGNEKTIIKSIEMHHESLDIAYPGDCIGFCIKGLSLNDIKKGYVIGDENNDPPLECIDFEAQIVVLNHPSEIHPGYTPLLLCHTISIPCKIESIISKIDRRTGKSTDETPKCIKKGDSALVRMIPTKPVCLENYKDYPSLGRFALRDLKQTIAVGIITKVNKKAAEKKKFNS